MWNDTQNCCQAIKVVPRLLLSQVIHLSPIQSPGITKGLNWSKGSKEPFPMDSSQAVILLQEVVGIASSQMCSLSRNMPEHLQFCGVDTASWRNKAVLLSWSGLPLWSKERSWHIWLISPKYTRCQEMDHNLEIPIQMSKHWWCGPLLAPWGGGWSHEYDHTKQMSQELVWGRGLWDV